MLETAREQKRLIDQRNDGAGEAGAGMQSHEAPRGNVVVADLIW